MSRQIFSQNIISVIWDFDRTLIPGYMLDPLFSHFGVDQEKFWEEVSGLPDYFKSRGLELVSDSIYLNHILSCVRAGIFKGLNNRVLKKLGSELDYYPGLPEFLEVVKRSVKNDKTFKKHEIRVEHYIVSTGLRQIILGSEISKHVDGVWGCEFIESMPAPGYLGKKAEQESRDSVMEIGYVIDNTTKTRAIFEINKGVNKIDGIEVNSYVPNDERRIPFRNMIYIADGPSDIPVFSVVNRNGGRTFAVYQKGSRQEFAQVNELQKQERVHSFGEADYTEGTQTSMWILDAVEDIARRIVKDRAKAVDERIGPPPKHLD